MADCARVPGWSTARCCLSCHESEWTSESSLCAVVLGGEELEICCAAKMWWEAQSKAAGQPPPAKAVAAES